MIDVAKRDEIIKDHIYCPEGPKSEYTIKKVFDDTKKFGQFHYHMSNCGHQFLASWDKDMIWGEPTYYPELEWRDYVFAAVFTRYWSEALFGETPKWVYQYKFQEPQHQYFMPQEVWSKLAPIEFQEFGWYAEIGGVWYI